MPPSISTSGQGPGAVEGNGTGAASKLAAGFYVVATPIGNAGDITRRALEVLSQADAVVCEDTRVTGRLLARYGIATQMVSYHEHNAQRMRPILMERARSGEALALVSDAGTPLVSDPGFKLVREAVGEGLAVTALPGPSAMLAALVLSGLPSDRFLFAGFLPPKTAARRTSIGSLKPVEATLIFYESAQRLADTLADLAFVLGPRDAAVARELTKLFEEVRRGTLSELAAHYGEAGPPKGEIVVVVGPPVAEEREIAAEDVDELLREALDRATVRDAAAEVAARIGQPRRIVYARALALSQKEKNRDDRR